MHFTHDKPNRRLEQAARSMRLPRKLGALIAAVLAVGLMGVVAAPALATTYSVTNLGSLGFGESHGLAINASGQVTGYSYTSNAYEVTCPIQKYGRPEHCFEHPYHPFLWSNGKMTDLGTFGGHNGEGFSINRSGEVVGWAEKAKAGKKGELEPLGSEGFLWNGTSINGLGAFGPRGINDSGEIAGGCSTGPCVLSNGTFRQLPNPTACSPAPSAINNNGEVIGSCDDAKSLSHGVIWQNGTPTDLGTLGGPQASAEGINNLGQVVGWAMDSTDADHGFVWSNGKMTEIPLNFPAAINDNGVIVGGPMVYSGGTLQNLNTLVPAGTPQIQDATAINDNGQIVANTSAFGGEALLLTPN
jgi:probable HAF family extracellular repeat protein